MWMLTWIADVDADGPAAVRAPGGAAGCVADGADVDC
jgi:hypothetical protein